MKKTKLMLGRAVALACLAVASQAARADAPEWSFVYTGFDVKYGSENGPVTYFDPNYTLKGSFYGTDANSDGVLTSDELSSLTAYGIDFLGDSSPLATRTVEQFSYSVKDGLSFKLKSSSHDPEGYNFWDDEIESGVAVHSTTNNMFSGFSFSRVEWTAQTTFELTSPIPSPVPEPSQWMLLGAGAALLMALRRRHATLNR